jgi:hypothetical protein
MLFRIVKAEVTGTQLVMTFEGGESRSFDLASLMDGPGLFADLKDPHLRATVEVAPNGRSVEFANGLDFCADQLWQDSIPVAVRAG